MEGISVQGLLAADLLLDKSKPSLVWKASLPTQETLMEAIPFWWDPVPQALLPEAASKLLSSQKRKLRLDWELASKTLSRTSYKRFEYVWFIVGTRTFYYTHPGSDGKRNPDECLALVPIADYFNHADVGCIVNYSPTSYTFSTDRKIEKGEEVFISYGHHSNDFLLAEYGFCLAANRWDSICLDTILLASFNKEHEEILRSVQYWGDYTLNADSVCYRTEVAVRLLCMPEEDWRQSLDSVFDIQDEIQRAADNFLLQVLKPYSLTIHEKIHQVSLLDSQFTRQKSILTERWEQILRLVDTACTRIESQHTKNASSSR